jgi:hypothetical protein
MLITLIKVKTGGFEQACLKPPAILLKGILFAVRNITGY